MGKKTQWKLGNIVKEISQKEQKRQLLEKIVKEIQKLGDQSRRSKIQITEIPERKKKYENSA